MWFCAEPFLSSGFRIRPVPDVSVSGASGPSVPRDPLAHIVPLLVAFVGTLCPVFRISIRIRNTQQHREKKREEREYKTHGLAMNIVFHLNKKK